MIEPTILDVLGACIMPILAIGIVLVGIFGLFALLDILSGKNPSEESLSMFFEEGAIFGPRNKR